MPRNVRNFWVSGTVDGYAEPIGMGPKAASGGFQLEIRQRHNGDIDGHVVKIEGEALGNGRLRLTVVGWNGDYWADTIAAVENPRAEAFTMLTNR